MVSLNALYGDRFVSVRRQHIPVVRVARPCYDNVGAMGAYLDGINKFAHQANCRRSWSSTRTKMLALSGAKSRGASIQVTPKHTAEARDPRAFEWLAWEQKVTLETDPQGAGVGAGIVALLGAAELRQLAAPGFCRG